MASFLYKFLSGKSKLKPQVIIIGALMVVAVFAISVVSAYRDAAQQKQRPSNPFTVQPAPPKRDLDYKIIKVDSIAYGSSLASQQQQHNAAMPNRQSNTPAQNPEPQTQTSKQQEQVQRPVRTQQQRSSTPSYASAALNPRRTASSNSNMIIVDRSQQQQTLTGGTISGGITGLQSTRLKLLVVERTPVTNGSLVEARVMNDASYGNIEITRRSQILGTARLQNNRIEIDFREIRTDGKTYTCTGRAYDLKNLPGIPYNPLSTNAKQALLDEFKSAASGVPLVGRIVNQPNFNPVTDELAALDEGMEFYGLITSIY